MTDDRGVQAHLLLSYHDDVAVSDNDLRFADPWLFSYQRQSTPNAYDIALTKDVKSAISAGAIKIVFKKTISEAHPDKAFDKNRDIINALLPHNTGVEVYPGVQWGADGHVVFDNGVSCLLEFGYMDSVRMFSHLANGNHVIRVSYRYKKACIIINGFYSRKWLDVKRIIVNHFHDSWTPKEAS